MKIKILGIAMLSILSTSAFAFQGNILLKSQEYAISCTPVGNNFSQWKFTNGYIPQSVIMATDDKHFADVALELWSTWPSQHEADLHAQAAITVTCHIYINPKYYYLDPDTGKTKTLRLFSHPDSMVSNIAAFAIDSSNEYRTTPGEFVSSGNRYQPLFAPVVAKLDYMVEGYHGGLLYNFYPVSPVHYEARYTPQENTGGFMNTKVDNTFFTKYEDGKKVAASAAPSQVLGATQDWNNATWLSPKFSEDGKKSLPNYFQTVQQVCKPYEFQGRVDHNPFISDLDKQILMYRNAMLFYPIRLKLIDPTFVEPKGNDGKDIPIYAFPDVKMVPDADDKNPYPKWNDIKDKHLTTFPVIPRLDESNRGLNDKDYKITNLIISANGNAYLNIKTDNDPLGFCEPLDSSVSSAYQADASTAESYGFVSEGTDVLDIGRPVAPNEDDSQETVLEQENGVHNLYNEQVAQ